MKTLRIVDPHNRPKRSKNIHDFSPREAVLTLWEDGSYNVLVPSYEVPGYNLKEWLPKLVNAKQIKKY